MGRSKAPVWVGFGAAALIVLVAGNKWATDQLIERLDDVGWLRSLLQAQWLLTADGRPFDLYLVINSFVVVYLIALFVLLRLTLPRVDHPFVALTTAWGATVAAGLIGGLARGLLAEITDNPFFATSRDPNLLDTVVASADFSAAFAVWSGLIVGAAAAVAMAITSTSDPSPNAFAPSTPGAVQPPPPMPAPGPAPPPAPIPGTAGDPPSPAAPPPGSF